MKTPKTCKHKHTRKIEAWSGAFHTRYVWCDDCGKKVADSFKGKPDDTYRRGN